MFNTEEGPGAEGENCKHLHAADSQPASHDHRTRRPLVCRGPSSKARE